MLWPILECSAVAAGLWVARFFVPVALALPADVASLAIICTMFVWLTKRALKQGISAGLDKNENTLDRILTNFESADHLDNR